MEVLYDTKPFSPSSASGNTAQIIDFFDSPEGYAVT